MGLPFVKKERERKEEEGGGEKASRSFTIHLGDYSKEREETKEMSLWHEVGNLFKNSKKIKDKQTKKYIRFMSVQCRRM